MLRIIAGDHKRRLLETPPDADSVRPLPDRVRVALFNMLNGHFEGEEFVDVFAGSGSFGLEAISRGCERCVLIEKDREAAKILERNIESLGVEDRASLFRADALGPAALASAPRPTHVVFFDPPYPMMIDPALRQRVLDQFGRFVELLDPKGFAILRTPWPFEDQVEVEDEASEVQREPVSLAINGAIGPETHSYGSTAVHWYMRDPAASGE